MENFLPETLSLWLTQYGSFALFVLLALGIFALPIPDETLMIFAGILIAHDKLSPSGAIIAAIAGAAGGITISYTIGRTAGVFLIRKYGRWLRITEAKMQYVHVWFERIGRWSLLVGYFVPGIRHLTGYAAGITRLEYRQFALFSYSGATLWACIFLSIGYFLGDRWESILASLENRWGHVIVIALCAIAVLLAIFWWWRIKRKNR